MNPINTFKMTHKVKPIAIKYFGFALSANTDMNPLLSPYVINKQLDNNPNCVLLKSSSPDKYGNAKLKLLRTK